MNAFLIPTIMVFDNLIVALVIATQPKANKIAAPRHIIDAPNGMRFIAPFTNVAKKAMRAPNEDTNNANSTA